MVPTLTVHTTLSDPVKPSKHVLVVWNGWFGWRAISTLDRVSVDSGMKP